MIRRREKRRHFSPFSLDLRDPYQVVSLAVRFDESRGDEDLLRTPLETGRLYDHGAQQFLLALEYLELKTTPPGSLQQQQQQQQQRSSSSSSSSSSAQQATHQQHQQPQQQHQQHQQQQQQQPRKRSSISSSSGSGSGGGGTKSAHSNSASSSLSSSLSALLPQSLSSKISKQEPPHFALTPIILSGLLTALQQQREESSSSHHHHQRESGSAESASSSSSSPPARQIDVCSSDLVAYCNVMRRSALARIASRKKRRRMQRIFLPLGSFLVLVFLYLRSAVVMRTILVDLGYVESCDWVGVYEPVCRWTEAALWDTYRNYLLTLTEPCNKRGDGGDCNHDLLKGRTAESPFAMHTALKLDFITLDELDPKGRRERKRPASTKLVGSEEGGGGRDENGGRRTGLRWVGESMVNRLAREALEHHLEPGTPLHVLDVGCGVGGTLYALLPPNRQEQLQKFSYHGITLSAAEVLMARRLVQHHSLDELAITFEQTSFDDPMSTGKYTAVIAIESMSYSRHLERTLTNMVQSLKPGGVLIVVEDIVYPGQQDSIGEEETTRRPSLLSHTFWMAALQESGCRVEQVQDLGLAFEFVKSPSPTAPGFDLLSPWLWGAPWEAWLAGSGNLASRRLLEMRQERADWIQAAARREVGYDDADLSYQMYICIKPKNNSQRSKK